MKPAIVLYATREGQTRRVAGHMADKLRSRGIPAELVDAADNPNELALDAYGLTILAASVHVGRHEPEMVEFVKRHLSILNSVPAAFVSISLSEAGAEDLAAPPESRRRAAEDVDKMIHDFLEETGWHPNKIKAVAGAMQYSKYNFFLRFIMKQKARQAGAATDTTRDYEYTDWAALDHFIGELLEGLPSYSIQAEATLI